jgi:hypothetical protein
VARIDIFVKLQASRWARVEESVLKLGLLLISDYCVKGAKYHLGGTLDRAAMKEAYKLPHAWQ